MDGVATAPCTAVHGRRALGAVRAKREPVSCECLGAVGQSAECGRQAVAVARGTSGAPSSRPTMPRPPRAR
eukprot:scaffold22093_cov145-Isochrysis_galbana.AAC.8